MEYILGFWKPDFDYYGTIVDAQYAGWSSSCSFIAKISSMLGSKLWQNVLFRNLSDVRPTKLLYVCLANWCISLSAKPSDVLFYSNCVFELSRMWQFLTSLSLVLSSWKSQKCWARKWHAQFDYKAQSGKMHVSTSTVWSSAINHNFMEITCLVFK